jgi:Fe-S cluster biogenesis protein NfuA/nitrite reductase/ring-hydroxylating ferredoxin subunit
MSQEKNLRAVSERIDGLLQELGNVADHRIREKAEELVRLLMELYGSALARVVEIIGDTGSTAEAFDRLAADDLVSSLLILHGLHPHTVETRIMRALDRVRPYLGSHGGDVKLLKVTDGVVHLRLEGSCHGCPSSTLTMKLAIEKAIEEAAPEIARIEVEGANESGPATNLSNGATLEKSQPPGPASQMNPGEWIAVDPLPRFIIGDLAAMEVGGAKIVVCRVGETLYAYQDSCPSCGVALREGPLRENILTCSSCGRRYDVRRAGQCIDAGELHMQPLPLLVEKDGVKIAVGA